MKEIYVGKRSAIINFASGKFLIAPWEAGAYMLSDSFITKGFATKKELRRAIYELRKVYPDIKVHWLLPTGLEGVIEFASSFIGFLVILIIAGALVAVLRSILF
jgi:hypothetical protein